MFPVSSNKTQVIYTTTQTWEIPQSSQSRTTSTFISLLAKRCTNPTYNIYICTHKVSYIYITPRYVGLRRRSANRKNKGDVWTCTANECTDMIDTSQIDHTLPVVKKFKRFQSAHFFVEGNGEKSQVCMLETCCFRHASPVHPKPPPVSSKCTGNWILILLEFFKRALLKFKREGSSEGLLWLGTLPNQDSTCKRLSRSTNGLVNNFAIRVDPTPCT